jgi:hypothetical protein
LSANSAANDKKFLMLKMKFKINVNNLLNN